MSLPTSRGPRGGATRSPRCRNACKNIAGVSLYLINVGVTDPSNVGLGDLRLSSQVVAAGGSVEIETDVSCLGFEGQRKVELDLTTSAGTLEKISEQIKLLKPGEPQTVAFTLASLKPGLQQGQVKIVGEDSLKADDVRYLSIEVRPPWPVLVVAQLPTAETSLYLTGALAPVRWQKLHQAHFECTVIGYSDFAGLKSFDKYAAVFLLDPPGLVAGELAAPDRLCHRRARRRHFPRPARRPDRELQLGGGPAASAGQGPGASAARGRRHISGAAELSAPDPQSLRTHCHADPLEQVPRLSLLANRRPDAGRQQP